MPVLFVTQIFFLPYWQDSYLETVGKEASSGHFVDLAGLFSSVYLVFCLFSKENQEAGRLNHLSLPDHMAFLLPLLVFGLDMLLQSFVLKVGEAWSYWMVVSLLKIGLGMWLDSRNGFFIHRHWWPQKAQAG